EIFPTADVVVQVNAAETDRSKLLSTVRVLAARRNLGAHAIRLCREANSDVLELHLEVDETLSLEQAHEQVSGFEHALKETLPQIDKIVSHIEPSGEETAKLHSMTLSERSISDALHQLKQELGIDLRPHSVRHYAVRNEISVSFHCYLDGRTNVAAAHDWTIKAEQALRAKLPDLGRVVIHVEPPDADQ
ncbi:MAG TPA: cation transporter dimerization domain-containing protein, partial [Oligoflexia bacterium]|nr:cation transporter dimerization domain-containing protein [Oligoflexia bacterium]